MEILEQFGVSSDLLRQQSSFLRAELEGLPAVYPVEVLEYGARVLAGLVLWILTAHRTALQVVRFMYVFVWREEVVHDDKVDLPAVGQLYPVQTVEAREERVRVALDVLVV